MDRFEIIKILTIFMEAISVYVTSILMPFGNDSEEEEEEGFLIRGEAPPRIEDYIKVISRFNHQQFRENFRLTETQFEEVLIKIAPLIKRKEDAKFGHQATCVSLQFLASIWLLANQESFRSVGCRFNLAKSTLHGCFVRVVLSLNEIASVVIKWPNANKRLQIRKKFEKMGHFSGVVGAVDGTYIPIKAPRENSNAYVNRKCFYGITLQAIVSHNMKYIDCFVGYPSSVSDTRIFTNSDFYKLMTESPDSLFSENEYILGDKAYPNSKFCVPPFIERGAFQQEHKQFNYLHAKTRQVVERSFALLFGQWRRLKYLNMSRLDLICLTVVACCVLHNACLTANCSIRSLLEEEGRDFQNMRCMSNEHINVPTREIIFQNFIHNNIILPV